MDVKTSRTSPVLTDPAAMSKSRLGIHSSLLPYSPSDSGAFPPDLFLAIPRKKTGVLDDLRASSWLDAMQASSPPHKRMTKEPNNDFSSSDTDIAYRTWLLQHPSALACFEQIMKSSKGKRIALFLDYDGTLSPIVDNPDCAVMSNAMHAVVKRVAKYFPTAIISGRSRGKVYEFVGLAELYYAVSHGMDIMAPVKQSLPNGHPDTTQSPDKQEANLFQPAREFLPLINEVFHSLVENTKEIKGVKVENNMFCVSVHYRNVDEKRWAVVAERVHEIIKHHPSHLQLTHGRKVLEVPPVSDWDKGKAVTFLLESLGLSNCEDVLPIYVGDDPTDEDAFKIFKGRKLWLRILVSSAAKESKAFYSLRDPSEVKEFLKSFVMWKQSSALRKITFKERCKYADTDLQEITTQF